MLNRMTFIFQPQELARTQVVEERKAKARLQEEVLECAQQTQPSGIHLLYTYILQIKRLRADGRKRQQLHEDRADPGTADEAAERPGDAHCHVSLY